MMKLASTTSLKSEFTPTEEEPEMTNQVTTTDSGITSITTPSFTIRLRPRHFGEKIAKVRVYVPSVEPEMEYPPYTLRGEDPAIDKAWRAYHREEIRLMRQELQAVCEELEGGETEAERLVISLLDDGLKFSRKAGCPCGCSAGFVSPYSIHFNHRSLSSIGIARI
jgi:hypothetical protein